VPPYPALRAVSGWFTGRTPVRYSSRSGGVAAVLSVDAQLFPTKESCLVEGQTPCSALLSKTLTLGVLRGSRLDAPSLLSASWYALGRLVGKAAERMMGRVPVPYHASRDQRVRWESDRRIKCPGSRARVRRRTLSLRSTPLNRSSLFPYSTVVSARPLSGSLDVFSVFEAAAVDDCIAY